MIVKAIIIKQCLKFKFLFGQKEFYVEQNVFIMNIKKGLKKTQYNMCKTSQKDGRFLNLINIEYQELDKLDKHRKVHLESL